MSFYYLDSVSVYNVVWEYARKRVEERLMIADVDCCCDDERTDTDDDKLSDDWLYDKNEETRQVIGLFKLWNRI